MVYIVVIGIQQATTAAAGPPFPSASPGPTIALGEVEGQSMNGMAMNSLTGKHWAKWLPKKVAQHKADGDLSEAIQGAATKADREIEDLIAQGYQRHEAEEAALPMFILLKPEPEAKEASWERRELAAQERRYLKAMAPPADDQESLVCGANGSGGSGDDLQGHVEYP